MSWLYNKDEDRKYFNSILKKFTNYLLITRGTHIFYFDDFKNWLQEHYNTNSQTTIDGVLNHERVVEVGDIAYRINYDVLI